MRRATFREFEHLGAFPQLLWGLRRTPAKMEGVGVDAPKAL